MHLLGSQVNAHLTLQINGDLIRMNTDPCARPLCIELLQTDAQVDELPSGLLAHFNQLLDLVLGKLSRRVFLPIRRMAKSTLLLLSSVLWSKSLMPCPTAVRSVIVPEDHLSKWTI
jgi:hypothetical protein